MWSMPPTCRAHADGSLYGASSLTGNCWAEATHTVTAYALATPGLPALHAEDTCATHAQPLADHWQRRGLRKPGGASVTRVLARVTPGHRHAHLYAAQLLQPLPGMPPQPPPPPSAARPAADYSTVTLYDDGGHRWARVDVEPSDRNRDGKTRREMIVTLARAYDCDPTAAPSLDGPWSHRLDLTVFGRETHVIALRRALPWLLGHAESSGKHAMRGYTAWLRRQPEGHHSDQDLPGLRRAWRRQYLTSWANRWAALAYAAAAAKDQPDTAGTPPQDQAVYCAVLAAHHDADRLWHQLQQETDRARLAERIAEHAERDAAALGRDVDGPVDPAGAIAAPGILQPPAAPGRAVHHGRRRDYLRPLRTSRDTGRQLALWHPPRELHPIPPVPARTPQPQEGEDPPKGRPLLDVLLADMAQ